MSLKIEIPDNQLGSLKEYYGVVYEKFKVKSKPIIDEWNEIHPILKQLGIIADDVLDTMNNKKSTVAKSFKELNEYNKKWGWLRKSEYVIEKKGIPLTTKEIIKELADIHEQDIDLKLAGNSLPATLSVGAKEGKINRTKNEKGDYVYSLIK